MGEVLVPEVVILDAVAEHEVDGGEHGRRNREDRFLRSTAALEAKELRLEIATLLPPRALRLILEWNRLHKQELVDNWERARLRESLRPIAPLE